MAMQQKTIIKNTLRLGVAIAISAAFLWLAFRHVEIEKLKATLSRIDLTTVVVFLLGMTVQQIARVLRWAVLVRPFAKMTFHQAMLVSNVGIMLILILPLRLGEFARPYLLKREVGAKMTSSLGAAAVERTLDGLLVTGIFFVSLWILPSDVEVPPALLYGGYLALAVFGGALLVIGTALAALQPVTSLLRKLIEPFSQKLSDIIISLLEGFIEGFRALPDRKAIAGVMGYTFLYWGCNGFIYYWVMRGFGFDVPLIAGYMVVAIVVFAIMIPAAPGFLGAFQWALVLGLSVFGVGESDAAAYGLVVYPASVFVIVAFGLPYLIGLDGGLRGLIADSQAAEMSTEELT